MSRPVRLLLAVLAAAVLGLAAVWIARRPLSEAVVERWFAGQDVPARYRITAISPGAVTLADVSLGPVGRPDFTADRVEARIGWAGLAAGLDGVTLVRPHLRATVRDGRISFGSVDRLIPPSPVPAVPLPSIALRLLDAGFSVETAAGTITGRAEGSGRFNRDFVLRATVAPVSLGRAGCAATIPDATVVLTSRHDATRATVDGGARGIACAGATISALKWRVAATLPPTLDRYDARLTATAERAAGRGITAARATIDADARAAALAGPVSGNLAVAFADLAGFRTRIDIVSMRGPYSADPATGAASLDAAATATNARITLPDVRLTSVRGTLAAPLLSRMVERGRAAARVFDGAARLQVTSRGGVTGATLTELTVHAASGARLIQTGRIDTLGSTATVMGQVALNGGGLPSITLSGDGRWARTASGNAVLTVAPFAVPGASLDTLRVEARAGSATVVGGEVRVSGALGGGLVARRIGGSVAARIDGGTVRLGTGCTTLVWASLTRDAVSSGSGAARLCPLRGAMVSLADGRIGGGIAVAPLDVRATADGTPLAVSSGPVALTLSGTTARPVIALAPAALDVRLGDRRVLATAGGRIDLAARAGRGRVDAVRVEDPALPVAVGAASGDWRINGGRVALDRLAATVTDRATPARFEPMRVTGSVTLEGGRIAATGAVALAATPARLLGFTAIHDLATARGSATIDAGALTFGPGLQPFQISEALRGVVENVRGPVTATGRFDWSVDGVKSTGTVAIENVSLATAALGPVDGIAGNLIFDDLLAMTTPPGQVLRIARINPGVAVDDGVAIFRLLGPDTAAIESIRWPYAGGTLTLAPVELRAADTRRTFVLTVDGLDAEAFLQKFEIKNINVTGRFDGRLPLVFADGHGRIERGILVARSGGGLVQYVGDVGGDQLGAGARLAFDALRRLRYRDLALDLDGDLDGELVTSLRFSGTNETAATIGGGPLPIRATSLPFRFTVQVRAPFRALLGTAASFGDVRPLLRPAPPVQPR